MTTQQTRSILAALHLADYAYLGVRPKDSTPPEAPAIILDGRTATDLAYAMATAGEQWPECEAWELIGSDEQMIRTDPRWQPTMHALRTPATLATFSTAAGPAAAKPAAPAPPPRRKPIHALR
jgi:hypothetical protein